MCVLFGMFNSIPKKASLLECQASWIASQVGQGLTGIVREIGPFGIFLDVGAQRDGLAGDLENWSSRTWQRACVELGQAECRLFEDGTLRWNGRVIHRDCLLGGSYQSYLRQLCC